MHQHLTPGDLRPRHHDDARLEADAHRAAQAATAIPLRGMDPRRGKRPDPALPRLPPTPSAEGLHSPGRPLPEDSRATLEQAFGWQLDGVRLHDAPAERGHAHAIGARAFASGAHIVHAGPGPQPEPQVLAHEVAHVVQSATRPAVPRVQRYEAPEHADLGDQALDDLRAFLQTPDGVAWAKKRGLDAAELASAIRADPLHKAGGRIRVGKRAVGGTGQQETVELSPGEIIAMAGDLYASPEGIATAATQPLDKPGAKNEIDRLRETIVKERKGEVEDPNKAYEDITGGRYLKLAKQNDEHFAPKNRQEWRRLHEQALAEAKAAKTDEQLQHALLVDAAGGHFLTDAYAAGHLFKKNELLAAIHLHLAKNPLKTENPEAQTYAGIVTASGNADQLVLKNIHDRLNREGFDVTNAAGMSWRTYGDAQLAKALDTQRIAALAVFKSRQQVYAAKNGQDPNPDDVQALMPDDATLDRATQVAISYIPAAASPAEIQGLMYRGRNLASGQFPWPLGPVIQSNLSTIADPGRDKRLWEMEQAGQANPSAGKRLAPQFTIGTF